MKSMKWQTGCEDLRKVLLDYLVGTRCFLPGGANITIEDVLNLYDSAMQRRQVPNREKLLRQHPDLAEYIAFYLASR